MLVGNQELNLHPTLIYMSKLGYGLYRSNLKPARGYSQHILAGFFPDHMYRRPMRPVMFSESFSSETSRGDTNHTNTISRRGRESTHYTTLTRSQPTTNTHHKTTTASRILDTLLQDPLIDTYRCPACQDCQRCRDSDMTETLDQRLQEELHLIGKCVSLQQDKIVCKLPLSADYESRIKNNKFQAQIRLRRELEKISNCPTEKQQIKESMTKMKQYMALIKDLPIEKQESLRNEKVQYYLPASIAYKAHSSTTKARVCADASSKAGFKGESLNACLPTGKISLNMARLIQSWMALPIAISTDVTRFHNSIHLQQSHHTLQRFLWIDDFDPKGDIQEYIIPVLQYGVSVVPALTEVAMNKIVKRHPILQEILRSRYVDDIAASYLTTNEAKSEAHNLKETLHKYGFELKGLAISHLKPDEALVEDSAVGIRGLLWNIEQDTYRHRLSTIFWGTKKKGRYLEFKKFEGSTLSSLLDFFPKEITLRQMLSKIAAVYDPIGRISPLL